MSLIMFTEVALYLIVCTEVGVCLYLWALKWNYSYVVSFAH